jgi:hypothetical protein
MKLALIIIGSTIGVLAGLAGAVYGATQAFDTTKTDTQTFSQPVEHVVIEVDAGDLEVAQGDRTIEVRETRHYLFDSPELSRSVEDGVLTLRGECDGVLFAVCETDYRVEIPEGVTVELRTHAGDIEAEGIDARRIDARSNVGDVRIEATRRADVEARTNVGDVEVRTPAGTYDVDADTDVGDTDLAGIVSYDRARCTLQARTNVGDVDVAAR